MATYKAAFYHSDYQGRLCPRSAYSMGLTYWWARLGWRAPGLANAALGMPGLGDLVKWLSGIAKERTLPRFTSQTFTSRFRKRGPHRQGRRKLLWPDAFNNHWQPENLKAAVAVLEAAGFEILLPRLSLCCARPLYAFGMLNLAKRQFGACLDALSPLVERGMPVVGLEPVCVTSFRDELIKLFPRDARAQRLAQNAFLFGEFLARQGGCEPPRLSRKPLVHVHCHHHAVIGTRGEEKLLSAMRLNYKVLDFGCCGMAGAFGFEADHDELSLTIAGRVLLPVCGKRLKARCSSATVTVAVKRSPRPPAGARFTSRKCCW